MTSVENVGDLKHDRKISDDAVSMSVRSDTDSITPDYKSLHDSKYKHNSTSRDAAAFDDSEIESLIPENTFNNNNDNISRFFCYPAPTVEIPCKVIIIGDSGTGKTSFVQRYVSHVFLAHRIWTAGDMETNKIRKHVKHDSVSDTEKSETSGYLESSQCEIMTDNLEKNMIYYDESHTLKQHPVLPDISELEFSTSEFTCSFETVSDSTIYKSACDSLGLENSLKFQDSEFISSFNVAKYEQKYGQYNLSKIELPRKIILLGEAGSGKTSYIQRYISKRFNNKYLGTIGVDFTLKVVKWSDNITIKLQLWDIAGQERFASMTRVYYKDAHACIIMFDLTHRNSFLNALKWKRDLDAKCTLPDGNPVPCILLANKCDLPGREVSQVEIEQLCQDQEFIGWTEVSVKDGLMVEESMKFLLDDMMTKYGDLEESTDIYDTHTEQIFRLDSKSTESEPKQKCCWQ